MHNRRPIATILQCLRKRVNAVNFGCCVDLKIGWRTTESHGETRRKHLHLQLRSGQLHNGKRFGAHGSLHLIDGGDFGLLERIPKKNDGVLQTRHPLTKHSCSVQSVHKRVPHTTLGSSHTDCNVILVRQNKCCHLV